MNEKKLMQAAKQVSKNAYCKYSNFAVGAAILGKSGKIYTGVNVENASFGLTNCAERSAIFSALADGEKKFVGIAIYVNSKKKFPPCGACRQVFAEFCKEDFVIIYFNEDSVTKTTLKNLLPNSFSL